MKVILAVMGVLFVLGLPIAVIDGMWAEPSLRDFARTFDGSPWMWVSLLVYYGVVVLVWVLKFGRAKGFPDS